MYTMIESWVIAFFFLFIFAALATRIVTARALALATGYRIAMTVLFVMAFFFTAVIVVDVVEDTINSAAKDGWHEGIAHQKVEQLLSNRWMLTSGWYDLEERPFAHQLRFKFGDTTTYVTLSVRMDGIKPGLEVVFPLESWKLVPPKPEVKWLGERWTLVSLPDPQPRAVRIERYEGREYGYEPRVVEARF